MFTELPEDFRPHTIDYPFQRVVDRDEWNRLTNDRQNTPDGYELHYDLEGQMLYAFADARHVEFVDLRTGKLCFPPEMMMVEVFKSIAKARGPFVVGLQYAFRSAQSDFPYTGSPHKSEVYTKRMVSPYGLLYEAGLGELWEFRDAFARRMMKRLQVRRYDVRIGIANSMPGFWQARQHPNRTYLLIHEREHIIYPAEVADENE